MFILYFIDYCFVLGTVIQVREILFPTCLNPIGVWYFSYCMLYFLGRVVTKAGSRYIESRCLNFLVGLTAVSMIIFFFVWTNLGLFWIIENHTHGNECLSPVELLVNYIMIALVDLSLIVAIIYLIYVCVSRIRQRRRVAESEVSIQKLYSNNKISTVQDVEIILKNHKRLFESEPFDGFELALLSRNFKINLGDARYETCSICLGSFEGLNKIVKLTCTHEFDEDCLFKWLKVKPYCPVCRVHVRPALFKMVKLGRV